MILRVGRNLETTLQEVGHTDNSNTVTIQQATMNDRYFNQATESTNTSPLLSEQHQIIAQHNNNINSNVYCSTEIPSQISLRKIVEKNTRLSCFPLIEKLITSSKTRIRWKHHKYTRFLLYINNLFIFPLSAVIYSHYQRMRFMCYMLK